MMMMMALIRRLGHWSDDDGDGVGQTMDEVNDSQGTIAILFLLFVLLFFILLF